MVAIGLYVGRRNKSSGAYFLGDKSFSGLVIGISFIGSVISSSTFLAIPADGFKTAWLRFVPNLAFPIITFLAAWLLVPFFRRGTITSAYQYLSIRFGGSISAFASVVFIVTQLLRTSMIAYLLALLVAEMFGWSFFNALILNVGVTALYTVKGGIKAVIWTDVIQTFVLLIGGLACVAYAIYNIPGGFGTIFTDAVAHNKFSFYDMNAHGVLVPTKWFGAFGEKTVLMLFLVGCLNHLNTQFDQSTVQRWCSARTADEARKSMYVLSIGCVPVWALFQFIGVCLFVFFLWHPDSVASGVLNGSTKAEQILPYFIMKYLSGGLAGLVIAGAFAAGMSTLSACINVSSMVVVNDLYRKYINKNVADSRCLFLGKASSLFISVLMLAGSMLIYNADMLTLTDTMLIAAVVVTTGIPAVFIAGMFTRRVGVAAIWPGIAVGMMFVVWVLLSNAGRLPSAVSMTLPSYYVGIFGNLLALAVMLILSMFVKACPRDLTNLTVWSQTQKPLE